MSEPLRAVSASSAPSAPGAWTSATPRVADDPLECAPRLILDLFQATREALGRGDLETALEHLQEAIECAADQGPELRDRLECARAAMHLEVGREVSLERLRAVLMSSGNQVNQLFAAYQIGRWFELDRQFKKGLFYAQVALDRAALVQREEWLAPPRNLYGNLLMAESRFDEALAAYREALANCSESERSDPVWMARIRDNIGYCHTVLQRPQEGLRHLYWSLRQLRRAGAERYQISTRLDLAFALLEVDRPEHALRHATAALDLAERFADVEATRNALYLLGHAAATLGRVFTARRAYDRLARGLGHPELTDFLLHTDARQLVNLKA